MTEKKPLPDKGEIMYFRMVIVLIVAILLACCGGDVSLPERLTGEGLEVANLRTLQENELPPGAKSGQAFIIPKHCADCGGKILIFRNETDAARMADTWRQMNQHVYTNGGTLLQINGTIDKQVADQYGEVLLK